MCINLIFYCSCWYENEQAIDIRRALAILGALCDNVKGFADVLLQLKRVTGMPRLLHVMKSFYNYALDNEVHELDILTIFTNICQKIGRIVSIH